MARYSHLIYFLSCLHGLSSGSKILVVTNVYAGSSLLSIISISEALVERGHQVDIVNWKHQHDYPVNNHDNITFITLSMENSNGDWTLLTKGEHAAFRYPHEILTDAQSISRIPSLKTLSFASELLQLLQYQCQTLLENKRLFRRLKREEYDIAIVDLQLNDCGLALVHQLRIPILGYWAIMFSSGHPHFTTAFLPSSHVPASFSQFRHEMNFLERTWNVATNIGFSVSACLLFYLTNYSIQKYYPGTPYPTDLLKNINGMLINSDPSIDYPRLLPPSFINIGGYQIRPKKSLPQEIEDWIESSGEHGVILVAMGLTHDLNLANKNVVQQFMDAFSKFPQKFIVKFEGVIDNIPSNVKVLKWLPQTDILGHPKTKAFVMQCGLHGVLEAVYYAVPMICMPLAVDHGDLFTRVSEREIGLGLDKDTVTTEDIHQQLKEVLNNPKYKNNVNKVSGIMRDVKETPRERTVDFVEYMIRQKGAEHLMLSSRHLNWFQYYSLDSIAFLLIITFLLVHILYKSLKLAQRMFCNQKLRKTKKID